VLVVDDHEVVRRGLAVLLGRRQGIRVVGEAGSVAEAVRLTERTSPDVVLMDMRLPDGSGATACRLIRETRPATRILVLSAYGRQEVVLEAIAAGACGYLLKSVSGADLVRAVEEAARGQCPLDPGVTSVVMDEVRDLARRGAPHQPGALTPQELAVLRLLSQGRSNREIGERMSLSGMTVKNHVSSILSKLGLRRRTQAAGYVARHGWFTEASFPSDRLAGLRPEAGADDAPTMGLPRLTNATRD
jgi:DNA-binding NarL/FixJ family response regulator